MKYIEVDEDLYRFIASKTERIGESASDILRRLLCLQGAVANLEPEVQPQAISEPSLEPALKEKRVALTPVRGKLAKIDASSLVEPTVLASQKGAVGRFLYILERLALAYPQHFSQVLQVQGRGRLYFAVSKQALLQASETANPKEIGQSGYWVTTNNNTAKKQNIMLEVLLHLGCDEEGAQVIAELI
ncbi:replication initiation negative regulator SeqA [Shewanella sp. NIFS-20-20]|uniref:replication initiation negative regulator SeqA n=1 Tax=Shewanella sp. NIFS-20-20 TaxID=2853806 RepID=UPI001C47C02B|nr:replication initiation negative regulator SeqA [Shewanella sp. NIFS-20-20]MBV7315202.1 replication initiation negative regulator SeqA [Shewanella sp. NIFS-20-20]